MDRCYLCPGRNTCVPPSGPLDAEIMIIGEAPGKDEDKRGIPFIGKTGQELNEHYLPLAGLRRENVYASNSIKCLPCGHGGKLDINRSKDLELLYACSAHSLYEEISTVRPKLIVPLGAFACHSLSPDIELDLQHGIPMETSFGTVLPMYHPAGGIHEPKKMLLIRSDWYRLGKYLKGKLTIPVDPYPNPKYRVAGKDTLIGFKPEWFKGIEPLPYPMACDTEVTRNMEPFCLTFSITEGTGFLIKAEDHDSLHKFQTWLDQWTGPILFHNWLFDQKVVAAMGLHFPRHLIVDTMTRAYHLGNLPQGLKALAYRELGMEMTDFMDVVLPYSTPIAIDYLEKASFIEFSRPDESLIRDSEGEWKLYRPQSVSTKIKRFLTDYSKDQTKSPFDAWDNWESDHALVEASCGPWPGVDIRHAPFEKVLTYACRDADATLRLYLKLQKMTRNVRKTTQERWAE